MSYKAFQDWYHEAELKHLLLFSYKGRNLISPPFATELCKTYSKIWHSEGHSIELDLPPVTSKTSACAVIDDEVWIIPYGIYDNFNTVVQISNGSPIYHTLPFTGKGQYYSVASDNETAFSFPLGYEGTNFGIYIKNNTVTAIKLPMPGKKLHMGTVFCNNSYWSMPRGDTEYNLLLEFDGSKFIEHYIDVDPKITRKYTDIITKGNTLYSLPFGETAGLNEVVEFDTQSKTAKYHKLNVPDFAKKYNCAVLLDDVIIGLPYGDEHAQDSNWGVVFDTINKTSKAIDIGISHGGKYRYRCGVAYKDNAYFFPSGTPSCPILQINKEGNIVRSKQFDNILFGRPIVHANLLHVIAYDIKTKDHNIYIFDNNLRILDKKLIF